MKAIVFGAKYSAYDMTSQGGQKGFSGSICTVKGKPLVGEGVIGFNARTLPCKPPEIAAMVKQHLEKAGGAPCVFDLDVDTTGKGDNSKTIVEDIEYLGVFGTDWILTPGGLRIADHPPAAPTRSASNGQRAAAPQAEPAAARS
jgi:hypothetical protein